MGPEELRYMEEFKTGELVVDPRTQILTEGANSPLLYTTLRGMGLRHKLLPNGRRQVISFIFPGDFLGLQAGVMGEMGHSVEAVTQMTLCTFDRQGLWAFMRDHTERAFALTWLAAVEEHFLGESLTTIGQRSAEEAVAWALSRIWIRGEALGLAEGMAVPFPFRQQDLADTLGLSLVHTNKTLAQLRQRGLADWSGGMLRVPNLMDLAKVGLLDDVEPQHRPLM